jgi:hypothetical protein
MLQMIRNRKLLSIVLNALIVLGLWSNAMAALFCPHMSGSSDSCLLQNSHSHSHGSVSNAQTSMEHMDHTQRSEMDEQDMTMDMTDMQMRNSTSQSENDSVKNDALQFKRDAQGRSDAITQPREPCSHCMMHSRSGADFPFRAAVQKSTTYQVIAAHTTARIVNTRTSSPTFLDLHDHGPPGSSAPLYVLVNAFRI